MKRAIVWTSMLSSLVFAALAIPAAHSAPTPPALQVRQPDAQIPAANSQAPAAASAIQQTPAMPATPAETGFESQINRWVQALAKEKGFEAWNGARWDSYPLGPGTHGWLILVSSGGKDVGYLIVGAAESGTYKLLEYGTGEKPVFGMETLYRSLVQLGLIHETTSFDAFATDLFPALQPKRLYAPPMQAVWRLVIAGETIWFDAKSGEKLPDLDEVFPQDAGAEAADNAEAEPGLAVTDRFLTAAFDPFERPVWIKGKPLEASAFAEIQRRLKAGERITYSGKWFGGKVVYPLAVTGYHVWTGDIGYLGLDQDGTRYAPYPAALGLGRLYR